MMIRRVLDYVGLAFTLMFAVIAFFAWRDLDDEIAITSVADQRPPQATQAPTQSAGSNLLAKQEPEIDQTRLGASTARIGQVRKSARTVAAKAISEAKGRHPIPRWIDDDPLGSIDRYVKEYNRFRAELAYNSELTKALAAVFRAKGEYYHCLADIEKAKYEIVETQHGLSHSRWLKSPRADENRRYHEFLESKQTLARASIDYLSEERKYRKLVRQNEAKAYELETDRPAPVITGIYTTDTRTSHVDSGLFLVDESLAMDRHFPPVGYVDKALDAAKRRRARMRATWPNIRSQEQLGERPQQQQGEKLTDRLGIWLSDEERLAIERITKEQQAP